MDELISLQDDYTSITTRGLVQTLINSYKHLYDIHLYDMNLFLQATRPKLLLLGGLTFCNMRVCIQVIFIYISIIPTITITKS